MNDIENLLKKHKFVIFGSDHYNTLGAVRSLGEKGITPDLILHPHYRENPIFSNNSRYVGNVYIVKTVEEGFELLLKKYGNEPFPPFVYSCDDWVESILDLHRNELINRFYFFHGNNQGAVTRYMDKDAICKLAKDCGLIVPNTELVKRGQLPQTLKYPIITKSQNSTRGGWKEDVYICKNEKELLLAYRSIKSDDILLEEFIDKETEFSFNAFSFNDGKRAFLPYIITCLRSKPGTYGKYLKYTLAGKEEQETIDCIRKMIRTIGFCGVFSVDFLKGKDGKNYFLEVSFRNSAFSYPVTYGGINMLYCWAKGMLGGDVENDTIPRYKAFKALVEIQDFQDSVLGKDTSLLRWVYELITADCLFYFNKKDLKPTFAHILHLLKKTYKKIVRL